MATALTGEGAFLAGGRWNSRGKRVVYASQSLSLAVLEMLVHIDNVGLLLKYAYCGISFSGEQVEALDQSFLPSNWKDDDTLLQAMGDEWIDSGRSAVLAVPSAIIDIEINYLINPAHPDFDSRAVAPIDPFRAFDFDSRLERANPGL